MGSAWFTNTVEEYRREISLLLEDLNGYLNIGLEQLDGALAVGDDNVDISQPWNQGRLAEVCKRSIEPMDTLEKRGQLDPQREFPYRRFPPVQKYGISISRPTLGKRAKKTPLEREALLSQTWWRFWEKSLMKPKESKREWRKMVRKDRMGEWMCDNLWKAFVARFTERYTGQAEFLYSDEYQTIIVKGPLPESGPSLFKGFRDFSNGAAFWLRVGLDDSESSDSRAPLVVIVPKWAWLIKVKYFKGGKKIREVLQGPRTPLNYWNVKPAAAQQSSSPLRVRTPEPSVLDIPSLTRGILKPKNHKSARGNISWQLPGRLSLLGAFLRLAREAQGEDAHVLGLNESESQPGDRLRTRWDSITKTHTASLSDSSESDAVTP